MQAVGEMEAKRQRRKFCGYTLLLGGGATFALLSLATDWARLAVVAWVLCALGAIILFYDQYVQFRNHFRRGKARLRSQEAEDAER